MYIKNNKGAAFLMVIVIVAVLMIMSSVMLMVHLAEGKTAIRHENKEEAYYVARSGVEALGSVFLEAVNIDDNHLFLDKIEAMNVNDVVTLDPRVIRDGTVLLSVKKISESVDDSAEYVIEGTSEVNGVEEKIWLHLLYEEPTMENIFKDAIYSFDDLVITGFSTIENGTVGCGGTITYTNASDIAQVTFITNEEDEFGDEISVSYGVGDNEYIEENFISHYTVSPRPTVEEEDLPNSATSNQVDPVTINGITFTISTPTEYLPAGNNKYSIDVKNGTGTLEFDTGTDEDGILDIVVDTISVKGNITFKPGSSGTVRLYVRKEATFQTTNDMEIDPERFMIIGLDGSEITVGGNAVFKGYIYAPGGKVIVGTKNNNGATGGIFGGIVGGSVEVQGESTITYHVPDSDTPPFDGEIHMYTPLYWSDQQ